MSQIGTQGQQDKRTVLFQALQTARAATASALVTYKQLKTAEAAAAAALNNYRNFLFGNADHPGVLDGMANDV